MRRNPTLLDRIRLAVSEIRQMATTRFTGPCGHDVNGDPTSWSCPTCGSSGSSSS